MQQSNRNDWNVRFEVTFYGNDPNKGSFREIKEDNIVFNDEFEIENKLPFNNAANVEINFLIWVDTLPIEKLTKLPHDYKDPKIKYDKQSIEVQNGNRDSIALAIRLRIIPSTGANDLPYTYSKQYFTLLPHESQVIVVHSNRVAASPGEVAVEVVAGNTGCENQPGRWENAPSRAPVASGARGASPTGAKRPGRPQAAPRRRDSHNTS